MFDIWCDNWSLCFNRSEQNFNIFMNEYLNLKYAMNILQSSYAVRLKNRGQIRTRNKKTGDPKLWFLYLNLFNFCFCSTNLYDPVQIFKNFNQFYFNRLISSLHFELIADLFSKFSWIRKHCIVKVMKNINNKNITKPKLDFYIKTIAIK